jgi:hypothetical protein
MFCLLLPDKLRKLFMSLLHLLPALLSLSDLFNRLDAPLQSV